MLRCLVLTELATTIIQQKQRDSYPQQLSPYKNWKGVALN